MNEGTRPIDIWMLVIESLVLAVILGEALLSIWRWRKRKERASKILQFLDAGNELQGRPPGHTEQQRVHEWASSVEHWITDTDAYLKTCSPQASTAFLQNTNVVPYTFTSIAPGAHDYYKTLLLRLSNLKNIIEKPDIYC